MIGKCQLDECYEIRHAKGYCKLHYMKFRQYGDARKVVCKTKYGKPLKWLMQQLQFNDNTVCLKWPFATHTDGRGRVVYNGKGWQAHRLMCTLVHGEPPGSLYVAAHNCGKGHEGCVNPVHLRWDTIVNNHKDKVLHGTTNRGENHGNSKLTSIDVSEIRSLKDYYTYAELGRMYNVSTPCISDIQNNKTWSY